ncbi:MAG: hypothetical protein ACI4QN_05330 [Candidatus Coproplasma sp.]
MADNMNGSRTKADLIVEKISQFDDRIAGIEKKVKSLVSTVDENKTLTQSTAKTNLSEHEQLKMEVKYVSAQLESVCVMLNMSLSKITDELAELKKKQQPDLDELASLVASKIIIPEVDRSVEPEKLDYDALGCAVAKSIYVPQAVAEEIDYEDLATKIADKLPAPEYIVPTPEPVQTEVDYDLIAAKVAQAVNSEPVSADYIAAKVAEQIVVPIVEPTAPEIDVDELASKISDKIVVPAAEVTPVIAEETRQVVEVDTDAVATEVVTRISNAITDAINPDEIADCVAKKVGSISPEEFEITVDDDGCDSLAKVIEEKLNYEELASKVSEKIAPAFMGMGVADSVDAEELANAISDKLTVNAAVNEDALAEKAAAILSNYMPEVDSADIADKVIAGIIPAIPAAAAIDSDAIADEVSAKVLENQADSDFDIVIDDEGVAVITDSMKGELSKLTDEHYEKVENDLTAVKEEYTSRFDKVDEDIDEIKKLLLAGAVVVAAADNGETAVAEVAEEELVTVSDVVGDEQGEEEQDEVIDEIVSDIEETPAEGEILPDGMDEEGEGGVDFANMMKYNRSFIARIIQGTDEQKNYYGQVKTALLSYKKVNSNIAWGAERFNKGRETIARFKIRGKTLCLYLALDPKEFEYSVYHQVDVSDNKSMHGTPMMVKIKSPRGVKKAIRLIDAMLEKRDGVKRTVAERDYAAMYPYETIEELIEDGLVKDVSKK